MDGTISSASGGDASTSGGGAQAASVPMASQSNAPPPFLSKTYDMVDDPATDAVVSWSSTNNSFVVWNLPEFLAIFCRSISSTIISPALLGN
ncbi:hypothetical protein OIU77_027386 [Salix suchowensis]|uniref:HSF-type DNA-binding domain-containing protein n=1 Tax=Salix suchowensis TaxID=1278906 RepID=A0ABQ9BPW9_9ROSI|nr:hypothetical protein OIU77_027386 [Salix suchowensis]